MRPHRLALHLCVILIIAPTAHAQTVPFGKNKVQYRSFQWNVLAGEHVDIYYYPEEETLAKLALAHAEESVRDLARRFQHHPFERIPLIVYASRQHFEQTNLYPGLIPEGVLGFTEYHEGRIAIPFRGDYAQFRQTLRHEIVHALQLSKLAATRDLYPRQRRFSPQQIPWWTEGLAEHWASEASTHAKMYVRDRALNGRIPSLRELTHTTGYAAYPLGAELHDYLTSRFGERYILEIYENYWKYDDFEEALENALGTDLDELSREWKLSLQQRYFPLYSRRSPPEVAAVPIIFQGRGSVKPTLLMDPKPYLYFLSARDGYTSLYRTPLEDGEEGVERILQGESATQLESLNATESQIDAHEDGLIALVSRYQDHDALIILETQNLEITGRYQWPDLVGIKSPAWNPNGRQVVFEALSTNGISDLYTLDLETHQRTRLTSDRYRDWSPDWSPDGRHIAFASDRTRFGDEGHSNLFLLDLDDGSIRHLTYGPWTDHSPRWSHDGSRIAFTSDRDGVDDLYTVDTRGEGQRRTRMTGGAYDPEWMPNDEGLIFTAFSEGTFRIFTLTFAEDTTTGTPISLTGTRTETPDPDTRPTVHQQLPQTGWSWPELDSRWLDTTARERYRPWNLASISVASGQALITPRFGPAQGAQILGSDVLGNHLTFLNISALHTDRTSKPLRNLSATLLYLNLGQRLNYGFGAFRASQNTYDIDRIRHYDVGYGAFILASYPFSRFRRVELQLSLERNEHDTNSRYGRTRRGLLISNFATYTKDNSRWDATGPIDGERFHLSAGFVTCFRCRLSSEVTEGMIQQGVSAEKLVVSADYRRYIRTSRATTYALRTVAFFSDGTAPGQTVLGGSHKLRGYPRRSMAGSRVGWINQEWRFPILGSRRLTLPIGTMKSPEIQGAIFLDAGTSWTKKRPPQSLWGSYGVGLRAAVATPLVLRIDLGRRFEKNVRGVASDDRYAQTKKAFVDLDLGYNY